MLRINQIKLPYKHTKEELYQAVARTLGGSPDDLSQVRIVKESIDARKKPRIYKVYTVDVSLKKEKAFASRIRKLGLSHAKEEPYRLPEPGTLPLKNRPVIAGSGPAGLFCALMLARAGYRPVLLERGDEAQVRRQKVEAFWRGEPLDIRSNAQFGEGGAGTFSDGKLNTLVKDPAGRNREVLRIFAEAGAPEEICRVNKPHIGTDILIGVVQHIRREIETLGGEVRFRSQVTDLVTEHGRIRHVVINETEILPAEILVLAIGHSARDTFALLAEKKLVMEAKAFAVGVRIEHPQEMIQASQYGEDCPYEMPAASYKVTHTAANGRGVYSFCMCPGGYVVNASSEEGRLAVNGMSYHARDSHNANSAIIVTVTPEDFSHPLKGGSPSSTDFGETGKGDCPPSTDFGKMEKGDCPPSPLAGVEFQRRLEEKAYELGQGRIPQQLFGDFCRGQVSEGYGAFESCTKGASAFANLREIFPEAVNEALEEGIRASGRKIKGFDREDAILSGVESRTSSPVRIVRDKACESNVKGIYPCGEGAGYAGGITSAAMDGMRVAEEIISRYGKPEEADKTL